MTTAPTVAPVPSPTVPTLPVSALPIAHTSTPTAVAPTTAPTAVAPTSATSTAPAPSPTQRTLERQAVDLVASGQYERAAFIYEQLARQYPDRPVYRETARILRAKLDGGAPPAP
jgi:hypothetical protein